MRIRNLTCSGLCLLAAACGGGSERDQTVGTTTGAERAAMEEAAREESERVAMEEAERGTIAPGAEFDPGRTPAASGEEATVVMGRGTPSTGTGSTMAEGGAMERDEAAQEGRAGVTSGREMDTDDEMGMEPGTTPGEPSEPMAQTEQANMCPADIEGLNVRVTSIPSGGAMVFTAANEQVDELRTRLRRFAEMHQQERPQGGAAMPSGETGARTGAQTEREMGAQAEREMGAQAGEQQAMIDQASEIRVVEIPRGARLEVRMEDQTQVRELRSELRQDAETLRNGNCPVSMQARG